MGRDGIHLVQHDLRNTVIKNQEIAAVIVLSHISCKQQNLLEQSFKQIPPLDQVQMCKTETFTSRNDIPYLVQMEGRGLRASSGQCLKHSRVQREMRENGTGEELKESDISKTTVAEDQFLTGNLESVDYMTGSYLRL
ncbi:hypothetical protein Pyn_14875 [Prunus yedoensis var. nudiflora]|uniref:Uncharacterized protein n=1 Tax=Prunus yedoensis var. nudiflora TaxID=2094558 RepID=A0A314ZW65_PRUYE|nr:hypothetical protein Pyn_14875 [Prunus yedoensis var. nudiflora]